MLVGFSIGIIFIQICVWAFWVMLSDPTSHYEWEFHTKKDITKYLFMCFIPILPIAFMLYKKIIKFK